jgi:hypothetical protein
VKYKVEVTIRAEFTYTAEVEASSEGKAEDEATGQWRDQMPDDFQVAKGYISAWEVDNTEQLTWECEECEKQITEAESDRCDARCESCNEAEKAKDAAFWSRHFALMAAKEIEKKEVRG